MESCVIGTHTTSYFESYFLTVITLSLSLYLLYLTTVGYNSAVSSISDIQPVVTHDLDMSAKTVTNAALSFMSVINIKMDEQSLNLDL